MKIIAPVEITPDKLLSSSVPEDDYAEWNSATSYSIGSRVMIVAQHRCYESLTINANTPPASSPDDWLDLGATNRWRMFDDKVGTPTRALGEIIVEIKAGLVSSVALFNAFAETVRIEVIDDVEGVLHDETFVLQDFSDIVDYWEYCFLPVKHSPALIDTGFAAYTSSKIRVTLTTGEGTYAACGALVVGLLHTFSDSVLSGASLGIQSFSRKDRDEFGNWVVVRRATSKRVRMRARVQKSDVDSLYKLLESLDSIPAVYDGGGGYAGTLIYGFYRDFDIVIDGPFYSEVSIDIEGLI